MAVYRASDLLRVDVRPQGRAGVWFLNWGIKAKPKASRPTTDPQAFGGAGLYGLCFDRQLIYVGSYLGNDKHGANLGGDVLAHRWWTHIGAITARGSRVNIARDSLRALHQAVPADHRLLQGLAQAQDIDLLHQGAGNLCPLRRLLFAARHVDAFLAPDVDPDALLSRFEFIYHRSESVPAEVPSDRWAHAITLSEQALIQAWAPECNTTHVPTGAHAAQVTLAQADAGLREAMTDAMRRLKRGD